MKYRDKIILVILLLLVLIPIVLLLGNPISYALIYFRGNGYLKDTYPELDLKISEIRYDFKNASYDTIAASPTSQDTHFRLYTDGLGNISGDQYHYVTSGINTAERLGRAYRALADSVLDAGDFPWARNIAFGELTFRGMKESGSQLPDYGLDMTGLELDGEYDIRALGADHGRLTVYLHDDTVTMERAAELLLELKAWLDAAGLPFRGIQLTLWQPLNDQGQNVGKQIHLAEMLYEDIHEDGLYDRLVVSSE